MSATAHVYEKRPKKTHPFFKIVWGCTSRTAKGDCRDRERDAPAWHTIWNALSNQPFGLYECGCGGDIWL